MAAKVTDGGPLSLLVDFANGSVKRKAMPVLWLVNIHSAQMSSNMDRICHEHLLFSLIPFFYYTIIHVLIT